MRAIEKRIDRLEGQAPEVTRVVATVPRDWSDERKTSEVTALALAAGGHPPFSFIFVIEYFGKGGPTEARLVSMGAEQ